MKSKKMNPFCMIVFLCFCALTVSGQEPDFSPDTFSQDQNPGVHEQSHDTVSPEQGWSTYIWLLNNNNQAYPYFDPTYTEFMLNDLYDGFLQTIPEESGFHFVRQRLDNHTFTFEQVALSFISRPQFNITGNANLVTATYRALLGRVPDPAGFNYWLNELNTWMSFEGMISSFIQSKEFQNRANDAGILAN